MTAQQLKNAILQEAIEGRLVPQDPNDEPASILLDKIRKEKAKLVKDGKLKKKDLEESPVSEDKIPFKIPKSWEWVRLINLSKAIHYGYTASAAPIGNARLLRITDIQDDKVNWQEVPFCSIKEKDLNSYQLHNRDILIARTGGTVGKTYIVRELNDISVFASYLIRAIPSENVNEEYIKLFMGSPYYWSQLTDATSGTGQPNVNGQSLSNLIVPLPPLAEQKRIVAKIEELLPKVEEYGKAQDKLNELNEELPEKLKKSILQEAIEGRLVPQDPNDEPASVLLDKIRKEKAKLVKEGKIKKSALKEDPIFDEEKLFSIPSTWEWCKLGWIGDWGAGATPAKGTPEFYINGSIPWLRTGELNNGIVYDSEIKVTPYALQKCSLRECQIGDVLIAMYGATIGKVAIAGIKLTTNQACCACTPYQIYNKYLLYYLMASKQRFIDLGEGGAQPNISREKIVAFPFPLPPLAEQQRIVEKIEQLLKEIDKLKR